MIQFELKKAILQSGIKQVHIARCIGMDATTLTKKIHGYLAISEEEKEAIAKVLGYKVGELFPERKNGSLMLSKESDG